MSFRRVLALFCTASVLAGCAGSAVVPVTSDASPAFAAVREKVPALFRIVIPKTRFGRGKHARYISPSTQGITISLSGGTKLSVTAGLTPTSPGCTSGLSSTVCSLSYNLKPGRYKASLVTYDAVSCIPRCTIPAGAKRLSAAQSVAFTVAAGMPNSISLILSAVPAALSVLPVTSASVLNASQGIDLLGTSSHALVVQATDGDGNVIFGAGAPTYTVSQTGGTLALTLKQPSAASPNEFTVSPPAAYSANTATVTVHASYAGQATNGCAQPGAVCSISRTFDMKELVAVTSGNSVGLFELGSTTPYATLSFGIANPTAIAFDRSANLIVANCLQGCSGTSSVDNIAIFAPPYTGVPAFLSNGVYAPQALALDAAGDLFVANCPSCRLVGTSDNITMYKPPFSNGSAPSVTVTNGIEHPVGLSIDTHNDLWVANCYTCSSLSGDTVTSYASPYTGSPTHVLLHDVSVPSSIALDGSNNLFVANRGTSSVAVYAAPSYTDSFTPTVTVIGTTYNGGNLANPTWLATSGSDVWIADSGSGAGAVLRCGPPFQTAAPNCGSDVLTVQSSVNNPQFIALDGAGNLFVLNAGTPNVTTYAPPTFATATALTIGNPSTLAILP